MHLLLPLFTDSFMFLSHFSCFLLQSEILLQCIQRVFQHRIHSPSSIFATWQYIHIVLHGSVLDNTGLYCSVLIILYCIYCIAVLTYVDSPNLQNSWSFPRASRILDAPIRLPRAADRVAAKIPTTTNGGHMLICCRNT